MPYQPPQLRQWNKVGAHRAVERCITPTERGRFKVQICDGERRRYIGIYAESEEAREERDQFEAQMRPVDGRSRK